MTHSPMRPHARLVAATAVAALASLGLASSAAGDDASEGLDLSTEVTDHGLVGTEVSTSVSEAGTLPDGTPVLYIGGSGEPASFTVVNAETGELIFAADVPPKSISSPIQPLPDGSAFFGLRDGSGTIIYHWDAETHEITEALENPAGGRLVRELQLGDDGLLYGSTYPNTHVFSYSPETGEERDYGSVLEAGDSDSYAEGFAVHDGTAYVGTGMQSANFVTVDLDSGAVTDVDLPAGYEQITRFYRFQQVGDLIAMAFSPGLSGGTNTLFWDTANAEWTCEGAIDSFVSLNNPYSEATEDGRFYYKANDEIWEFDSTDCSVSATGWIDTDLEDTGTHRTLGLVSTGDGSEHLLLGLNRDGSFWNFDPATGEHEFFESQVTGSALTAHSIHVGPDEQVYMGIYLSPQVLSRFDPATEEIEQISGPSQADSWLTFDDQLLIGSYGNAVIHQGDPFAEWDWDTNPSEQFQLIGEQQDRVIQMATDGDQVAIATVADYGVQGGGLTLTDMTDSGTTYRDLVEAQSTTSVAYGNDDLIYAGTSIRGGLSSDNSPLDAHLVTFDPEQGTVTNAVVPVEGNDVVAGLVPIDDTIWGVTNSGDLFEFDTTTQEVANTYDLGTEHSASPWGLGSTVQRNPADGLLYGIAGGSIFAFDPETKEHEVLAADTAYKRMDIAADGTIYALDETNLFEITVTGAAPSCTDTIDSGHAGPLTVSEGTTCIEGGTVSGPITVQTAGSLIVDGAELRGPLRSTGAATVELVGSSIHGPVTITGTTGSTVLSDNEIRGPLSCSGNDPAPLDLGSPNTVRGPQSGQCRDL